MRIKRCRGRAPVPPADPATDTLRSEPKLAEYDTMLVESAALAFVVVEQPGGVTLEELSRELLITPRGDYGGIAIERAVHRLVDQRLLRVDDDQILPGPVFGSTAAPDRASSSN